MVFYDKPFLKFERLLETYLAFAPRGWRSFREALPLWARHRLHLPQQILTNAELAARIDTSDEWIVQRTGIRQRHIAADGEFTSHLAIHAARAALANAGVDAQSIDLIVLATSTPDHTFPATAVNKLAGLWENEKE